MSGTLKDAATSKTKADAARFHWCRAVNNDGRWGRWGYTEVGDMKTVGFDLEAAIRNLYADGPVTGLVDQ